MYICKEKDFLINNNKNRGNTLILVNNFNKKRAALQSALFLLNMTGKYKIYKNLSFGTTDKRNPKSIYLEGHLWVSPKETFNSKIFLKSIKRFVDDSISQQHLAIFELPEYVEQGVRSSFYFQIHILNTEKESFKSFCEKRMPIILQNKPLFLRVLSDCGLEYYQTKKGRF